MTDANTVSPTAARRDTERAEGAGLSQGGPS